MTHAEVTMWMAYRNKRGSLNMGRRIEQAIGGLLAVYVSSKSKPGTEVDVLAFMPHEDRPEPQGGIFDFDD
ncbi:hypothetical protein [Acinetobacter johnsonii]|jgi:hypothetical protein|uniref:hypothetical protein n=1 Tax=Acinetobacter johnsonii TaxID=40214 RepID=UPI001330CC3B|nr:hypothetical protein [Acinetobacter johnsonii]